MRSAGCACRDLVPTERGKSVAAPARSRVTRGLRLLQLSYESPGLWACPSDAGRVLCASGAGTPLGQEGCYDPFRPCHLGEPPFVRRCRVTATTLDMAEANRSVKGISGPTALDPADLRQIRRFSYGCAQQVMSFNITIAGT